MIPNLYWIKRNGYRGLKTKERIERGSTVFEDEALAQVIFSGCQMCLKKEQFRCSKCKRAQYCSQECQRKDWSVHKHCCSGLSREAEMLIRLCYEHKEDRILDLVHNMTLMSPQEHELLEHWFDSIPQETVKKLGMQRQKSIELLARFTQNNASIHDPSLNRIGDGTFERGSLLNHSCWPNCCVMFRGTTMIVRAITDIDADEELFISYIDPMLERERRREALHKYHFVCDCIKCNVSLKWLDVPIYNRDDINNSILEFHKHSTEDYFNRLRELTPLVPKDYNDLTIYAAVSRQRDLAHERLDFLNAAKHGGFLIAFMMLNYPPFYPMLSIMAIMTASLYFNAGKVLEAKKYFELADRVYWTTHGHECQEYEMNMEDLRFALEQEH
ncbi:hypothetical protein EDD86DRAFT_134794 [Gorgonomyces haynaldii]|nr:hypothetical protein EDD86DRAFT_134794 [Gorgonomyces haynaldii]